MNRLLRIGKYAAIVVLFALQACSSNNEDEGEGLVEQPVGPDWIHPACDTAALSPPSNNAQLCNGPWKYTYQEWWRNREACGNDPNLCEQHSACPSWDRDNFGDGLGYTRENSTEDGPFHSGSCEGISPCDSVSPADFCPGEAQALRARKIAALPGISTPALNGFSVTWEAANVQRGCTFSDNSGTFQCADVFRCRFTLNNLPAPVTAVHPWCPCAQQAPAECPRDEAGAAATFTSTDVPRNIPDNNSTGVSSAVVIPTGVVIKSVAVSVNVSHTFRGDLEISVIAPNGNVAMLSNRAGGSSDDFVATNLDISGSFASGSSASGTWKLRVRDLAAADVGTINSFSVTITPKITTFTGYTDPGANMSAAPGAPAQGYTRRTLVDAPSCTTCDALAVDTDTAVQSKFACLDSGIAAETGPLRSSLIARAKLLFQLAGERLSAAQRTRVETLYDQDASGPACSVAVPWESTCQAQAATLSLPGQLQLCQDLAKNDRTSTGVATSDRDFGQRGKFVTTRSQRVTDQSIW